MWEQEEYNKEGIDWTGVTFADNKPVLVSAFLLIFFIADQPQLNLSDHCRFMFDYSVGSK